MTTRVLIVGCGDLGSALAARLRREEHPVWGLRRSRGRLPSGIREVEADVQIPNTLRRLPDVDVVFYLVAPEGERKTAYRTAHVDGFRYTLRALQGLGHRPRRVFYASCLEIYGATDGRWVDEDSALDAPPGRARFLQEGEQCAADAPFPVTVVRLGEIYGPGRPGILESVLTGSRLTPDEVGTHVNLCHREDAVGALCHLMTRRELEPLYLVTDREPAERIAVAEWLAKQLGHSPPAIDGTAARGAPVDVRALSERLVDAGYRFIHPTYREGYQALLSRVR